MLTENDEEVIEEVDDVAQPEESETPSDDDSSSGAGVNMSQAALDKKFQERAARAARSAEAKVLEKAGVSSVDDLVTALDELKTLRAEKLTEQEKMQADLDEAKAKAETLATQLSEAQEALVKYRKQTAVQNAADAQGFLKESRSDVWLLVSTDQDLWDLLKINDGSDEVTGADKVVKKVAEMRPHWVQNQQQVRGTPMSRRTRVPSNTPPSRPERPVAEDAPLVNF